MRQVGHSRLIDAERRQAPHSPRRSQLPPDRGMPGACECLTGMRRAGRYMRPKGGWNYLVEYLPREPLPGRSPCHGLSSDASSSRLGSAAKWGDGNQTLTTKPNYQKWRTRAQHSLRPSASPAEQDTSARLFSLRFQREEHLGTRCRKNLPKEESAKVPGGEGDDQSSSKRTCGDACGRC